MTNKIMKLINKSLALMACTGAILAFTTGSAFAGHCSGVTTVEIRSVSWNGNQLTVSGCVAPAVRGAAQDPVTVVDTANQGIVLGTDTPKKNGDWTVTSGTCAESVTATHTSGSDQHVNPDGCGGPVCTRSAPTFSMGADEFIAPDGSFPYTLNITNNDTAACPDTTFNLNLDPETGDTGSFATPSILSGGTPTQITLAPGDSDNTETLTVTGSNAPNADGHTLTSTVQVTGDDPVHAVSDSVTTTIQEAGGAGPEARGDTYATPIGKPLDVAASRISGVLYNDFGGTGPLSAVADNGNTARGGSYNLNADGSFDYTPPAPSPGVSQDNLVDTFTYTVRDSSNPPNEDTATVVIQILSDQPDYKMTMNYELGMHCTGFEFAYCCVLPPYNSIVAQITKPQLQPSVGNGSAPDPGSNGQADLFPRLLDATEDPATKDGVGRETVLRDLELDANGNFKRYQVRYYHDAQPRLEGQGKQHVLDANFKPNSLISDVEGNSLLYHNTRADSAALGPDGQLLYSGGSDGAGGTNPLYAGMAYGAWVGNDCPTGSLGNNSKCVNQLNDPTDNYANAWLNHFYIYADLEGTIPDGSNSQEANKIRLGVAGQLEYPKNVGAALQPMGPIGAPGVEPTGGTCVDGGNPGEACTLGGNECTGGGSCDLPSCFTEADLTTDDPTDTLDTCVANFDSVLTWSTNTGTVVYTQMKVLEDLPVMLTSPRIWEGLGLPLTPFEDSIGFFTRDPSNPLNGPGSVGEEAIRPYVAMKAALHVYNPGQPDHGDAVIGSNGQPVIGFGTAPIDIPNCERCHSAEAFNNQGQPNVNSPSWQRGPGAGQNNNGPVWNDPFGLVGDPGAQANNELEVLTDIEYDYWMSVYPGMETGSDWYARLKSAAINMLALHDADVGTTFTESYPGSEVQGVLDQNTRLGFESVICQKCHADNVIAVVKSACKTPTDPANSDISPLCPDVNDVKGNGRQIIPPITEAIHWNHRGTDEGGSVVFSDALGRDGGCQGCHPAHRSDGVMDGYPITLDGNNFEANGDNRLAIGGCFVGRDVHSNPLKDVDGAETPEYLNAVGEYLQTNVSRNQSNEPGGDADFRGIWCTNCHNQLGQAMWAVENMVDLINGIPGKEADLTTDAVNVRALPTLQAIAEAVGLEDDANFTAEEKAIAWLDPTDTNPVGDFTHTIWNPDIIANPDATVATIELDNRPEPNGCGPRFAFKLPRFIHPDLGQLYACLSFDSDPGGATGFGDPSVRILDFCTTPDCVTVANDVLAGEGTCSTDGEACTVDGTDCADTCVANNTFAAAVPFDAATDGRDHWLSPGEPHCADCHAAPFTEQSGNKNFFPPFNYPRKASLMRYSRGHQDLTCQSCHESIHGLYPVSPTIDSTSYAQAASLNPDGSHGPLKCETCHEVDGNGVPTWMSGVRYNGNRIRTYDDAVAWAHTFTDNVSVLQPDGVCENCHQDRANKISETSGKWLRHSFFGRVGRQIQDKAEIEALGDVAGGSDADAAEDAYHGTCSIGTCSISGDACTFGGGECDPDGGVCNASGDACTYEGGECQPDGGTCDATDPAPFLSNIYDTVCTSCHALNGGPETGFQDEVTCGTSTTYNDYTWKDHLIQGRIAEKVWETVSHIEAGSSCGW